jgi:hypothetical protein
MAVNTSKTKFIIFHTRGKNVATQGLNLLFDDNDDDANRDPSKITTLERVHTNNPNILSRTYKLLGINLDEHLNLNIHISSLLTKLSRSLFFLKRAKNILPQAALKLLYYSMFHSHLLYCTNIISITNQSNLNKISLLQRKAIRIITNSEYNAHTDPLFLNLGILPFDKIIYLNKALFMHSVEYSYNIDSFNNIWQKNNVRNLTQELRNTDMYILPFTRIEQIRKFPFYSLPHTWNNMGNAKLQRNRTTFKIALIGELLDSLSEQN